MMKLGSQAYVLRAALSCASVGRNADSEGGGRRGLLSAVRFFVLYLPSQSYLCLCTPTRAGLHANADTQALNCAHKCSVSF